MFELKRSKTYYLLFFSVPFLTIIISILIVCITVISPLIIIGYLIYIRMNSIPRFPKIDFNKVRK